MDGQHSYTDWIVDAVIVCVGWYTRLVFGDDKLTRRQMFAFFLLCGVAVLIISLIKVNDPVKLSLMLAVSMIIPSLVKGVIKGGKRSEQKVSDTIEHNVENIAGKVDDIADALTKKKDDKK